MQALPVLSASAGWVSTVQMPFAAECLAPVRSRLLAEASEHDIATTTAQDAELVLAEFVSNSLRYARPLRGGLQIAWGCWGDHLHIHVTDGGSTSRPTVQTVGPTATRGRGLSLVRNVTSAWGVQQQPRATTVWATLEVPHTRSWASEPAGRSSTPPRAQGQ